MTERSSSVGDLLEPLSISSLPESIPSMSKMLPTPLSSLTRTPPRSTSTLTTGSLPEFCVELPTLTEDQKAQYATNLSERKITFEEAFPDGELREIIGEYSLENRQYYFVKLSDGLALKLPKSLLIDNCPSLVDQFAKRKEEGSLPPFDPSADHIHPSSRITLTLKLSPRLSRRERKLHSDDDGELSYGEVASNEDFQSTYSGAGTKRRATLRSQTIRPRHVVDSDEDNEVLPSRRSTRSRKNVKVMRDEEEYTEGSDEYMDSSVSSKNGKKVRRKKVTPPAYGEIRSILDLNYDSDEETAPLRAHRDTCEKCHRKPGHLLIRKLSKRKGKKKPDEDEEEKIRDLGAWVQCLRCPVAAHFGCLSATQRDDILSAAFEKEYAEWRAELAERKIRMSQGLEGPLEPIAPSSEPKKKKWLEVDYATEFFCGGCKKGGYCLGCRKEIKLPEGAMPMHVFTDDALPEKPASNPAAMEDVEMADGTVTATSGALVGDTLNAETDEAQDPRIRPNELLFRCIVCRRPAHYTDLPVPDQGQKHWTTVNLAVHYQSENGWQCADCISYVHKVDHILAWRPSPENAIEPPRSQGELPNYKESLPREYLVKWVDRSYFHVEWVPHMWLLATHQQKLKNFLAGGSHIALLPEPIPEDVAEAVVGDTTAPTFEINDDASAHDIKDSGKADAAIPLPSDAMPDAEKRIPPAWKTIDRVLDVQLWYPEKRLKQLRKKSNVGNRSRRHFSHPDDEEEEAGEDIHFLTELEEIHKSGNAPSKDLVETVEEWEKRSRKGLTVAQVDSVIDRVVYGFFKWDDLGYDEATWDSPPKKGTARYAAFKNAFIRFVKSREVQVKILSKQEMEIFDRKRVKDGFYAKHMQYSADNQPTLGQSADLKLMSFQIEGVNWLCNNWWNNQNCILADEMGLGKTVQIVTFLGVLASGINRKIPQDVFPALVVVPNSTITNWVREFERWAPNLRVCSFNGEAKAREIIKEYELFHTQTKPGTTGAKFHVLVTTYETITNSKQTAIFKQIPRWEVMVVDEGQRLKSDSSLLFKKLRELKTLHRVILTGTPLNNNIRELFNLMNFLDPDEWDNLDDLAREHEVLTEENIKELHVRLRPYFLRRIKSEVLQLPPKNEVIVPVSMSQLQKEIYRSILSQNLGLLQSIAQGAAGSRLNSAAASKSNLNNMLMQLRKCLQHPYLVSPDIEPKNLSATDAHDKLIDASTKLRLLKALLPKLKARGHRVLLFSQFVIALDIIEDFLVGEGIKYLRLDGNTKQAERQKDMDEYNKPNSDIFIYILSTRAGGVGINLWSADTVIIFDPDFNPHQDLQAIARAHRYGQKKTCLVFKLMVKDSAEERIMQTGKKKLVLDHLIVQKMDDDEGKEDVQSILTFGAQALFAEGEGQASREIYYSSTDIDNLIERTEKEGDEEEVQTEEGGMSFAFAKVWSADKDTLEELADIGASSAEVDSWAQTLARIATEKQKEQEKEATGRGVRRRAAAIFHQSPKLDIPESPEKEEEEEKKDKRKKKQPKSKETISDDSDAYHGSNHGSDDDSGEDLGREVISDLDELSNLESSRSKGKKAAHLSTPPDTTSVSIPSGSGQERKPTDVDESNCGLCDEIHTGPCNMTSKSENLVEYRLMLLTHTSDESFEKRNDAIMAIDQTLNERKQLHLIYGQPLRLVDNRLAQKGNKISKPKPAEQSRPLVITPPLEQHPKSTSASMTAPINQDIKKHDATHNTSTSKRLQLQPHSLSVSKSIKDTSYIKTSSGAAKRPLSPVLIAPPKKRKVSDHEISCHVCGRTPIHILKECPTVAEGPERVRREISRLMHDPEKAMIVATLQKILRKQQRREDAQTTGSVMS